MTKNEFELLRICRSAELAYFISEHKMDKPKFIQYWFKNKVKEDRQELTEEQIRTICSEWQLKQRTFYKKYRSFVDHFDKVIQNLQYLKEDSDNRRIDALLKQLEVIGTTTVNGLNPETPINYDELPTTDNAGLVLISSDKSNTFDENDDLIDDLVLEIRTLDPKRFFFILDIIKIHGFDPSRREKYIAGNLVKIHLASSTQNEYNAKVINYEHSRDKDWREELSKNSKALVLNS